MEKTLSLREANQSFARVVREVESGDAFTITRNGKPVARIAPIEGARRILVQPSKRRRWRGPWREPIPVGPSVARS